VEAAFKMTLRAHLPTLHPASLWHCHPSPPSPPQRQARGCRQRRRRAASTRRTGSRAWCRPSEAAKHTAVSCSPLFPSHTACSQAAVVRRSAAGQLQNVPNQCGTCCSNASTVCILESKASCGLCDSAQRIWTVPLPPWPSVNDQTRGERMEAPIPFGAPESLTPCRGDRLPQREARLQRPLPKPSRVAVLCTPIDSDAAQAGDLDRGCRIKEAGETQAILSAAGGQAGLAHHARVLARTVGGLRCMVPERTSSGEPPSAAPRPLDPGVSVIHRLHACSAEMASPLISTGLGPKLASSRCANTRSISTSYRSAQRLCISPRGGPQQQRQHAHPSA